jgi:3'-phosphoadenosine 5'-phosphosulfate sulfotransferase (PAPS reductase)/FAD synthetase
MKHVVALSGGKDSTAMALRLAEVEPREYVYVCTPTGDEPPEMFEHWRNLGTLLGQPLIPIMGGTLDGLIAEQNALPNWRQRWCTRMLKIEPFAAWMMKNSPATSYVGLRADEDPEEREGGDYRKVPGAIMDFPLRRWGWGLAEVFGYLAGRGVTIPPRTDCLKCFFQKLIEWYEFWRDHRAAWMEGERMEAMTGHTFRQAAIRGRHLWPDCEPGLRPVISRATPALTRLAQ